MTLNNKDMKKTYKHNCWNCQHEFNHNEFQTNCPICNHKTHGITIGSLDANTMKEDIEYVFTALVHIESEHSQKTYDRVYDFMQKLLASDKFESLYKELENEK